MRTRRYFVFVLQAVTSVILCQELTGSNQCKRVFTHRGLVLDDTLAGG